MLFVRLRLRSFQYIQDSVFPIGTPILDFRYAMYFFLSNDVLNYIVEFWNSISFQLVLKMGRKILEAALKIEGR